MSSVATAGLGCAAVLAFDLVGSLAARHLGFRYSLLAPGSLLIYALTGYLAAQASDHFLAGAAAGAAVAAAEATVGWRISRAVGADEDHVTERMEVGVAFAVTVSGALIGGLAGLAA